MLGDGVVSLAAFDALLGDLEDLSLDTPDAAEVRGVRSPLKGALVSGPHSLQVIGTFLARAVADDCVPPLYLGKSPLPNELAKLVACVRNPCPSPYTCLPLL